MSVNNPPAPRRPFLKTTVLVLLAVGFTLGTLWRFTSWHQRIDFRALVRWGRVLQGHRWTPLVVILIFMLGGLVLFAHVVILWATVFTFDTWHAFVYCELGSMASALTVYGLGRVLRPGVVARMAGSYMEEVSRALAHKGILTLVILHVFPICPFSMLNLLAGATHVRFKDFVAGTILGCTPGILFLCFFGNRVVEAVHHPHWFNVLLLVVFIVAGLITFRTARNRYLPKVVEP